LAVTGTSTPELPFEKRYVGLEIDQLRQLKQLQEENGKLKKLVAS
jgi:hypothetical protein